MKRFAIVAALALLSGAALAQPPVEVTPDDSIELQPGEIKVVEFDQPVQDIKIAGDGLVKVVPMTDRTYAVQALGPGSTVAIAYGPGGKEVHRFGIGVAGHLVKIYGQGPTPSLKTGDEYNSYICSPRGCGRVNTDVTSGPSAAIISDTKTDKDGNAHTVTREYR